MPKKPKTPPPSRRSEAKAEHPKPLYRRKPPKAASLNSKAQSPKAPPRSPTLDLGPGTLDIPHAHVIAPSHFTLRDDGSIQTSQTAKYTEHTKTNSPSAYSAVNIPRLVFQSDTPFVRLYQGNCLELLDAIAAKYPAGRFDCIFADPPYFLSNGGITCHAGKMVRVDKGDWDKSQGPKLNHEFNLEWLRRCQRVLKPNGTIWVSGTHHVIFSIGYALQQLGYKVLNDIAWGKPNPPPNLSCRYFTHSTETILWAAKNDKSKHVFNYQEMRKVTGKQMKTVWRKEEFFTGANRDNGDISDQEKENASVSSVTSCSNPETKGASQSCSKEEVSTGANSDKSRAGRDNGDLLDQKKENISVPSVSSCSSPERKSDSTGANRDNGDLLDQKKENISVPSVPSCSEVFPENEVSSCLSPVWTMSAPGSEEKEFGKHPTQKPVALVERCLLASTNEGDLVLDPFLGGGTTAVACVRLKRRCVGIELDFAHLTLAARRADREIIEIWLREFRVRFDVTLFLPNDLDLFSDSINGSRAMDDKPQVPIERIFHECKFVFLSCAQVECGAVVHTTVDVSLQEAWAKTPTGKKRETTHVVRCETEIFRVKSS